jgi:hypothetical protein
MEIKLIKKLAKNINTNSDELSFLVGEESAFLSRSYAELYIDQLNDLGSSLYQKLVPDR